MEMESDLVKNKGGRPKSLSPKTKPIGTRWDVGVLDILTKNGKKTPQSALNYLCNFWLFHNGLSTEVKIKPNIPKSKPNKKITKQVGGYVKIEQEKGHTDIKNEDGTINFGDDKMLYIEKYTSYPISSRPTDPLQLNKWKIEKRKSDEVIREQWQKRKLNQTESNAMIK